MSVDTVSSSDWWKSPTTTYDTTSTTGTNDLSDFSSFIKLLATELQYQDPSDPVSSTEYVSQMAQINSLQQMQTIVSSVNSAKAYSMIGKTVSYQTTDSSTGETQTGTGTVQAVIIKNSKTYLNVNNTQVDMDSVVAVSNSTTNS